MPPKGKIPDRWIPYKACGDVIEGTRLICFKVPLHKNVQHRVPGITKTWDIPAVLSEIPKLGAVIDLTNTARYYNPKEFLAANVLHRKILMPGREIPPEAKVREFMDAVDEFLGKDCVAVQVRQARRGLSTADTLVGVHCTHGLNRTGYMVCRYMRDRLNIPAKDAIERFEKARGYQIEREIYKAGLLNNVLPPPDFGKETVIKPLNTQTVITGEDLPRGHYSIRFDNDDRNRQITDRYPSDNYRNGRYYNERSYLNRHNGNRYYGDRYNGGGYYSDRNNRDSQNKYQSWRNRNEGDSYNQHHLRDRYRNGGYRSDKWDPDRAGFSYIHDY